MDTPLSNQLTPLNLLVIDGQLSFRSKLTSYLSRNCGHQVLPVHNAEEALHQFSPGKFDCAIIDTATPGMPSLQLAQQLSAQDHNMAIIITTNSHSSQTAIEAIRQGVDDFLVKPFAFSTLALTLERVAQNRFSRGENQILQQRDQVEGFNQNLLQRINEQTIARQLSDSIDKQPSSNDVYQGILRLATEHLKVNQAAIMVLNQESGNLLLLAEHGFGIQFLGQPVAQLAKGLCGKVAAEGQPMLARPGIDQPKEGLPAAGLCLAVPIKIRDMVFGVLMLAGKKEGEFSTSDLFTASFLLSKAGLSIENLALYEFMRTSLHSTLSSLISAMEAKDLYTRQHSQRVTNVSVLIAQAMNLDAVQLDALRFAAYLHDIGKIGIEDSILLKPEPLTEEEYAAIKQHPVIGDDIINSLDISSDERAIVLYHHERWDGKGYPHGLRGEEIPLLARIVAVADCYDAITSNRPYRSSRSVQEALVEIKNGAGCQFDPAVVEYFCQLINRYMN